jgi:hypothetical protein
VFDFNVCCRDITLPSKHCNNNRLFLNPAEDLPLVSSHQAGHIFMALLTQLHKTVDQKVQEMSHTYIRPQYECNIRFFYISFHSSCSLGLAEVQKTPLTQPKTRVLGCGKKPELLSASRMDGRFEKESQCYNAM